MAGRWLIVELARIPSLATDVARVRRHVCMAGQARSRSSWDDVEGRSEVAVAVAGKITVGPQQLIASGRTD